MDVIRLESEIWHLNFGLIRSESKSGYDKSLRKGGAGPHNWGAMRDEMELEREALEDAEFDSGELENLPSGVNAAVRPAVDGPSENSSKASTSSISEDEIEKAREFRAKGLKGNGTLFQILQGGFSYT